MILIALSKRKKKLKKKYFIRQKSPKKSSVYMEEIVEDL